MADTNKRLYIYKSKFFYLLLSLILYFVGTSFLVGGTYNDLFLSAMFSLLIIICIYAISQQRYIKFLTIFLAVILITSHWTLLLHAYNFSLHIITDIFTIIFLVFTSYAVLGSVTEHRQITADSLFGAVCGYFLVGLTWTFFYLLIALFDQSAFTSHTYTNSIHQNIQHFYYFSFSTMTTLGYGDILPVSNIARTCAWLEAVTGQIYLAVWISQLVGLRIAQKNGNGGSTAH